MVIEQLKSNLQQLKISSLITVFPLISAGPQTSAAPFDIHIEISASL